MADRELLRRLKQGAPVWNSWRSRAVEAHRSRTADIHRDKFILEGYKERDNKRYNKQPFDPDTLSVDLSGADLRSEDLSDVDLGGADLSGADLSGAIIRNARFRRAVLRGANLGTAALTMVNLRGADLSRANLYRTDLTGADLTGANLSGAIINDAILRGAVFNKVVLAATILSNLDLSTVRGLDTVFHSGPSTIGVETIYRSNGDIPEGFLRGVGLPDDFITYVRALTAKGVEFYSCFISYSSRDQEFADRIYADLQSRGVRCWFAPADLKIGDKTRERIDQSIKLHDKLLLVLSANSVMSQWVEHEVEAALERESDEKRLVLFPVRLDDTVLVTRTAWASNIRRIRNIGDFRRWKDHDEYQKTLDRVLRDLKAADGE